MSRFLKVVVNVILICAIVVAGGLLIPPFAGVTTVIVDELDMDTNLAKGAVAYAVSVQKEELKSGNKVLISEGASQYVYEITGTNGENFVLEDKLSTDGGTIEKSLSNTARKVVLIVPYIGYVSMALRTTEGLIIVGLAVIFIIILFILAEIWKKDEEDDELDEDEEEEDSEEEEEPVLSRRQQKKADKKAKKEAKKEAKRQKKLDAKAEKKRKKGQIEEEKPEADQEAVQQPEEPVAAPEIAAANIDAGETEAAEGQDQGSMPEQDLFAETRDMFAADIANMLQEGFAAGTDAAVTEDVQADEDTGAGWQAEELKEMPKKLAMPVYTKEELLMKAQASGDEPKIIEDEYSGVTLLDYSDIL